LSRPNWHPLTMISHMLDCQLYGLSPSGHHLTNLLLHTASAILLFLVLRRDDRVSVAGGVCGGGVCHSSATVESVAWVAERKDVLSGLFFMLTLWAYTRYAQGRLRVECREQTPAGWSLNLDYCLVLLFFALGLMCKPMVVTLPLVLLLLDYWPLDEPAATTAPLMGTPESSEGGACSCCWRNCPYSDWHSHRVRSRCWPSTKPSGRSRKSFCPGAWAMP